MILRTLKRIWDYFNPPFPELDWDILCPVERVITVPLITKSPHCEHVYRIAKLVRDLRPTEVAVTPEIYYELLEHCFGPYIFGVPLRFATDYEETREDWSALTECRRVLVYRG